VHHRQNSTNARSGDAIAGPVPRCNRLGPIEHMIRAMREPTPAAFAVGAEDALAVASDLDAKIENLVRNCT
jgi:hypothetical protein